MPQAVQVQALTVPTTFHAPEIVQNPRQGWRADCELSASQVVFGRGVFLRVESEGEQASGVRCRVFGPQGTIFDSTVSVFEDGSAAGTQESKHFPGEFGPKLNGPLPDGEYQARWFGDVGDVVDPNEVFLARTTFKVDEGGRFSCRDQLDPVARRDQLAGFIDQGHTLMNSFVAEAQKGPPAMIFDPPPLPLWHRRIEEYMTEVEEWLEANMERSFMMRFRNPPSGPADSGNPISQASEYAELRRAWNGIRRRVDVLHEFLKEV
jgi:hypothetical protein